MRVELSTFEELYAGERDPWGFDADPYEQRKYAITVASLPQRRYRRAFEPGSSIGALTERLAPFVDELVTLEASPTAAARAAERMRDAAHVDVRVGSIPEQWPDGAFDLVVFSELGYYWDRPDLQGILDRLDASLESSADLVAVHWLGRSPDHLLHGSVVHHLMTDRFGIPDIHHLDIGFVLDVWTRS